MQDLVTEAMFNLFNALPGKGKDEPAFTSRQRELSDLLDAFSLSDPLLDTALFRKLFSLGALSRHLLDATVFQELFGSDVVTLPEVPTHDLTLEPGDAGGSAEQAGAEPVLQVDGMQDSTGGALEAQAQALAPAYDTPSHGGDVLAAALGLAGLLAVQAPPAGRRGPPALNRVAGAARSLLPWTRKALRAVARLPRR